MLSGLMPNAMAITMKMTMTRMPPRLVPERPLGSWMPPPRPNGLDPSPPPSPPPPNPPPPWARRSSMLELSSRPCHFMVFILPSSGELTPPPLANPEFDRTVQFSQSRAARSSQRHLDSARHVARLRQQQATAAARSARELKQLGERHEFSASPVTACVPCRLGQRR